MYGEVINCHMGRVISNHWSYLTTLGLLKYRANVIEINLQSRAACPLSRKHEPNPSATVLYITGLSHSDYPARNRLCFVRNEK